jgi:uncharacterized membrane protein
MHQRVCAGILRRARREQLALAAYAKQPSHTEGDRIVSDQSAGQAPVIGLVTDGAYALIVAQFPSVEEAQAAYETLREVEQRSSLRIDGVLVAQRDAEGRVHLGRVTEHSTKTGLKWGLIGGVAFGVLFPPSIIASAAALGGVGAIIGKTRNLSARSGIARELEETMLPNTSALIAFVEDTAVVEVEKALAKAERIVTKAVDKQMAAEIDREAALAKESLSV